MLITRFNLGLISFDLCFFVVHCCTLSIFFEVSQHERRSSQLDALNEMPLYPTDEVIWDENIVPTEYHASDSRHGVTGGCENYIYAISGFNSKSVGVKFQGQSLLWRIIFIHSFILDISLAPLQDHYYSEMLLTTALILCRLTRQSATGNCK